MATEQQEWVSALEAAKLLGVHKNTIFRYVEDGTLVARQLPGGAFRIRKQDVLALLTPVDVAPHEQTEGKNFTAAT